MRECEEFDGNVGNQCGCAENLGGNAENAEYHCVDAKNQSWNVIMAVEMT